MFYTKRNDIVTIVTVVTKIGNQEMGHFGPNLCDIFKNTIKSEGRRDQ